MNRVLLAQSAAGEVARGPLRTGLRPAALSAVELLSRSVRVPKRTEAVGRNEVPFSLPGSGTGVRYRSLRGFGGTNRDGPLAG